MADENLSVTSVVIILYKNKNNYEVRKDGYAHSRYTLFLINQQISKSQPWKYITA